MKKLLTFSLLLHFIFVMAFGYLVNALGGLSYMWFKMNNRGVTGVYQHRVELFESMPLDSSAIVFLGNSITEQGEWSELLENPLVRNRGIAGDMTDGLLRRLSTITQARPKQLFLMIGVNDLIMRPPAEIITNYRKIIRQIEEESSTTSLVLQSILPVNNQVKNTGIKNRDIQSINKAIKAIASEKNLMYLDIAKQLSDADGNLATQYTHDGIHLNGKAYLVWKNLVKPQLKN